MQLKVKQRNIPMPPSFNEQTPNQKIHVSKIDPTLIMAMDVCTDYITP